MVKSEQFNPGPETKKVQEQEAAEGRMFHKHGTSREKAFSQAAIILLQQSR